MIIVQQIVFGEDEVTLTFATTEDLKDVAGVPVMRSSQFAVPLGHPSYTEIGELYEAAVDLVRDILEDHTEAGPWKPPGPLEDDDDD